MSPISIEEAVSRMSLASPLFDTLRKEWQEEWAGEKLPYISLFADFAMDLVRSPSSDRDELARVFEMIEELMVEGDQYVGEAAATGFLEQVLNEASSGRADFGRVRSLIGPKSAAFCIAWNRRTLGPSDTRFDP